MDIEDKNLLELKAEIIHAVAHPLRLGIVEFLADGEQCVCDIVDYLSAQRSNVSRHLSVMLKAGVLSSRKDGLKMMYSLKTPCIVKFLSCVEAALREKIQSQAKLLKKMQ